MRTVLIALMLLCSAPLGAAAPTADPTRLLESWARIDERQFAKLEVDLVERTLAAWVALPAGDARRRGDLALCSFTGRLADPDAGAHARSLRGAVRRALAARRASGENGTFDERLIQEVALMGDAVPHRARVGACFALGGTRHAQTTPTLLMLAREPEVDLRASACGSLVGRVDPQASAGLLEAAIAAPIGRRPLFDDLLATHLERLAAASLVDVGWTAGLAERLERHVLHKTLDPDWHTAAPAIRLARHTRPERGGAILTEALRLWTEREERRGSGDEDALPGARRMRYACADALRHLTGRDLGPDPRRWQQFWRGVRAGAPLQVEADGDGAGGSAASFFGLELRSDAVAFVIDASGSMNTVLWDPERRWGSASAGATRYEVACAELVRTLRDSSAPTDFRLVLFSDRGRSWKTSAETADDTSLARVQNWLARRRPDGGTQLSTGLAEVTGDRAPAELDVDTVVILCDGETEEDAAWADAWLAKHNRSAQLVFHCVQIGGARAAALERLTGSTGGSFVRIEG